MHNIKSPTFLLGMNWSQWQYMYQISPSKSTSSNDSKQLIFVWQVLALEPAIEFFFPPRKICLVLEPKIKESNCIKNILPSCCICIYLVLLCTTQQFWWIIECWPFDFPLAEICAALIRLCSTVLDKQIASDWIWIYSLSLIFLSLEQAFFLHAQLETMFRTAFLNIILGKKAKLNSFKRRKKN